MKRKYMAPLKVAEAPTAEPHPQPLAVNGEGSQPPEGCPAWLAANWATSLPFNCGSEADRERVRAALNIQGFVRGLNRNS